MFGAEMDSRELLLTESFARSLSHIPRQPGVLPDTHPGTLLKYGHGVSYFHPGAFHAVVSKGREVRNMSQK